MKTIPSLASARLLLALAILPCLAVPAARAFEQSALVEFTGTIGKKRGSQPVGKLVDDGKGYLWGVTKAGGKYNLGTIYKVRKSDGAFQVIRDLKGSVSSPDSGLTRAGAYMWGLTSKDYTGGAIFKIRISNGTFTRVATLAKYPVSGYLVGPLAKDRNGMLWGLTHGDYDNYGTIFKLDPKKGTLRKVVQFSGHTGLKRGAYPATGMVMDADSMLWGSTTAGGAHNLGCVFRLNPATGAYKPMIEFGGGITGKSPRSRLLIDKRNHRIWGTTGQWPDTYGTVFWYDIGKRQFNHYFSFSDYSRDGFPGSTPHELTLAPDGIWGTTNTGGHPDYIGWHGCGTLYRIRPAEALVDYKLYFVNASTGLFPTGGATYSSGKLWGVTEQGGATNDGILYRITP